MPRMHQPKIRYTVAPTLWLLFALLLGACRPVDSSLELEGTAPAYSTPSRVDRDPTLVLLHTNDTWGYIDPCG